MFGALDNLDKEPRDVQMAALRTNVTNISLITRPTLEQQLYAVRRCGGCIQYIQNPHPCVQLAAVAHLDELKKLLALPKGKGVK